MSSGSSEQTTDASWASSNVSAARTAPVTPCGGVWRPRSPVMPTRPPAHCCRSRRAGCATWVTLDGRWRNSPTWHAGLTNASNLCRPTCWSGHAQPCTGTSRSKRTRHCGHSTTSPPCRGFVKSAKPSGGAAPRWSLPAAQRVHRRWPHAQSCTKGPAATALQAGRPCPATSCTRRYETGRADIEGSREALAIAIVAEGEDAQAADLAHALRKRGHRVDVHALTRATADQAAGAADELAASWIGARPDVVHARSWTSGLAVHAARMSLLTSPPLTVVQGTAGGAPPAAVQAPEEFTATLARRAVRG